MLRGSHRVLQATLLVLLCLPGLVLVGRICLSSGLPKRARVHHTSGYAKRLDKHRPYLTASVGSEDKQSLLVEFSLRGAQLTCRLPICGFDRMHDTAINFHLH